MAEFISFVTVLSSSAHKE